MPRQQKLRIGDANALQALWDRFAGEQRNQVIVIFADLIAGAARIVAAKKEEHRNDAIRK